VILGWDQGLDRSSEDFFGQITENPLRALVPVSNDAIEIFADNGVVG
jgi:hypothetical protein